MFGYHWNFGHSRARSGQWQFCIAQVQEELRELVQGSCVDISHALPGQNLEKTQEKNLFNDVLPVEVVTLVVLEELELAIISRCHAVLRSSLTWNRFSVKSICNMLHGVLYSML